MVARESIKGIRRWEEDGVTTEERTLTEGRMVDGESLSVESRGGGSLWEAQMQEHLLEALEDYRRGVAEAPCVFKWSVMGAVASEPGQALRQAQDERGPGAPEWEAGERLAAEGGRRRDGGGRRDDDLCGVH